MDAYFSFGAWVQKRRRALDLTQGDLARLVGCAEVTIQKIEADARRPSRQIAELLAEHLRIAPDEWAAFIARARGIGSVDQLSAPETLEPDSGRARCRMAAALLPTLPLTSFVGRAQELATVTQLLAASRLLTLTGPGGSGKTRLALQLTTIARPQFRDGIWMVELARLDDPALVPQTIAAALAICEEPGQPLLSTLTTHLREKQLLLVLDNCEHLLDACAPLAEALLRACPHVRILTSSREPLGVSGEAIFRVPPLTVPDTHEILPMKQLVGFEAVQLFVARAQAVQPEFEVMEANAAAVAQICRRLDGLPLAIELAAARVRMLTVAQIAARLDDRFALLTAGSRTALPRHQTLQALIDWSYELLAEDERALLRRLAVFVGGWTLEAAEAVCAGEAAGEVLAPLTQLIDKSLVEVESGEQAARYRLLETIRQYALAKLAASGEAEAVRRRHAQLYLGLAETLVSDGVDATWLARIGSLEIEQDNLRSALAWSQLAAGGAEIGLRLVKALELFWVVRGHWTEARSWLRAALAHPVEQARTQLRAEVLTVAGHLYALLSDYWAAQAALNESLSIYEELGDTLGRAWVLNRIGWVAREQGDLATAWRRLEQSLVLYRELDDRHGIAESLNALGQVAVMREDVAQATALLGEGLGLARSSNDTLLTAWTLNHLGHVAQIEQDYARATRLHKVGLELFRAFGEQHVGIAWAAQGLGESALAKGDMENAREWLVTSLAQFRELGDRAGVAWCLAGLGSVAGLSGQRVRAAWLWGAAEGLRTALGARGAPGARATYELAMAAVRAALDEGAFAAAWDDGRARPLEQVLAAEGEGGSTKDSAG